MKQHSSQPPAIALKVLTGSGLYSVVILVFLFAISIATSAQLDTCYKTFFNTYGRTGPGNLEMKEVCRTSDGGYLMGGSIGPLYQPAIVKLDKKGSVEWNRVFAGDLWWVSKVVSTKDGNFIVATISYNTQLTKFRNDGTILWSKEFVNQDWSDLRIDGIEELPDGGFVLLFNAGYGIGEMYNYLVRIDMNANVIWKRKLYHGNYDPMIKSLLVEGDAIFIAADFYNTIGYQQLDIARLSLTSGNFVWKKRVEADNPHFWDPHLAKINDTLVLSVFSFENPYTFDELNRLAYINVEASTGRYLSSYRFENPEPSGSMLGHVVQDLGPRHVSKTSDNNLVLVQQIVQNNNLFLNLTKFTTGGSVIYSKNYINNRNRDVWSVSAEQNELLVCGRGHPSNSSATDSSFLMKIDMSGNVVSSSLAPGETCYNEPNPAAIVPTSLREVTSNFVKSEDMEFLLITDFSPQMSSVQIGETRYCNSMATSCRLLEINGSDSVCMKTPVTYKVTREAGCTSGVTWNYDNSFARAITVSDSSITLEFVATGLTTIRATMSSGCSDLVKEMPVEVFRNANSLDLGPDKNICFPATLNINAGKGFITYLWNNASTDSFVTVTATGKYFVKVMDGCRNFFSDTIIVAEGAATKLDIGPDRFKCNDDTLRFTAPAGFVSYTWGPHYNLVLNDSRNVVVQPFIDTLYYLKVEISPGCFAYDTVKITVRSSPPIDLGTDIELCEGQSILLDAGPGFSQYRWNDGQTAQQVSVSDAGDHAVYATTYEGCTSEDDLKVLRVWPKPDVQLNDNVKLCLNSSVTLDPGPYTAYVWQNGTSSRTFSVNSPGRYYVTVLDQHQCAGSDTIHITGYATPPSGFLSKDTALCPGENIVLKTATTFNHYLWSDNSNLSSLNISKPGLYWVEVIDASNCTGKDSVMVSTKDCVNSFFIPNAFTPDGNGNNDLYRPVITGSLKQYRFTVFDRSGQKLFTTTDRMRGWDGTVRGTIQPATGYVWVCTYQLEGAPIRTETGTVLLIR